VTDSTSRKAVGLLASASLIVALSAALFAPAAPAADDPKAYWQGRYQEVQLEYQEASQERDAATTALRKARQRNRLNGARRDEIMAELNKAEARYAAAAQAKTDFPEQARRAGAEPGWFPRN
jgi:opacity protein-like surface antigen